MYTWFDIKTLLIIPHRHAASLDGDHPTQCLLVPQKNALKPDQLMDWHCLIGVQPLQVNLYHLSEYFKMV